MLHHTERVGLSYRINKGLARCVVDAQHRGALLCSALTTINKNVGLNVVKTVFRRSVYYRGTDGAMEQRRKVDYRPKGRCS